MKSSFKLLMLALIAMGTQINAQNVIIDGEIRPRTEYEDGFGKPIYKTTDPGIFTTQRTRIGMTFTSGLLTTQITLQDSRVFGQYANSDKTATTGIFEAWANMLLFFFVSLTIGRQAIKYDDNRLFSASAWSTTGTTHDLALFKYSINDFQAHVGLAYNNNTENSTETYYTPTDKYRSMALLWLSTPTYNGFNLSAIAVDEGLQDTLGLKGTANYKKTDFVQTFTYGGNLKYENPQIPVSGIATAYFQGGMNAAHKTYNGKFMAVKLNYTPITPVTISIATDYYSGDNDGTKDGKVSTFKKLYGSNHSFNGYMEYWKTNPTLGLLDYYGVATGKVGKNLTLEGTFHVFNNEYKATTYGKDLGSEFDLLATYKLNTWTTIQGGYCRYFANTNTRKALSVTASDIRNPQWVYVMFTIKPTFLNTATTAK